MVEMKKFWLEFWGFFVEESSGSEYQMLTAHYSHRSITQELGNTSMDSRVLSITGRGTKRNRGERRKKETEARRPKPSQSKPPCS